MAVEGRSGESIVIWVVQIVSVEGAEYEVQFMDPADGDYGGCWELCMDEEDPDEPWLTTAGKNAVVCAVNWKKCSSCTLHMTDDQWDRIERKFLELE